jgi:hypothetical protein
LIQAFFFGIVMADGRRNNRGRETKLTPTVHKEIVKLIEGGNYTKTACAACGISEAVFYHWESKGRIAKEKGEKDSIYLKFLESIEEAKAKAAVRNVHIINKAALADAKHAEWWLERTDWKNWGRKDKHEVTGEGGGPVPIVFVPAKVKK